MECYQIIQITSENYDKCRNIWNMDKQPKAQKWLNEIKAGDRLSYAYTVHDEFLGEGSLVLKTDDPQYAIPGVRVYLSRLVVKREYRNHGIGKTLVDYLCKRAKELGFSEISIGVDQDNAVALHIYRAKGFNQILYEGEDEYGPYYKLLKTL